MMSAVIQALTAKERQYLMPATSGFGLSIIVRATKTVLRWSERAKQRRHLSQLTPREREDIGITAQAASAEAAKPFWLP